MLFTHCGKLGDMLYSLPLASAHYKRTGERVTYVLPRCFEPFRHVGSLLKAQKCVEDVRLVDHEVHHYGLGGQPFMFSPRDHGIVGPYVNIGFPRHPDKYVPEFYSECFDMPWDADFALRGLERTAITTEVVCTETLAACFPEATTIDLQRDILDNALMMASAIARYCAFSAMAVVLYLARVPFILCMTQAQRQWLPVYFPDDARFMLLE